LRTIHKYPLELAEERVVISMPAGAQVLRVAAQHGRPCIWAVVNTEAPMVEREFRVAGTGRELPGYPGEYVGTCDIGEYVWHVFEDLPF
jgi:hypothetical protein